MSTLCPYRIIKGDDGLSVKVEWDVHYLTDEQIGTVRKYVAETEAENSKLRELVRELWSCAASLAEDSVYHIEGAVCGCGISCVVNGEDCSAYKLRDRMRELGLEVE